MDFLGICGERLHPRKAFIAPPSTPSPHKVHYHGGQTRRSTGEAPVQWIQILPTRRTCATAVFRPFNGNRSTTPKRNPIQSLCQRPFGLYTYSTDTRGPCLHPARDTVCAVYDAATFPTTPESIPLHRNLYPSCVPIHGTNVLYLIPLHAPPPPST